jgi:hypothetical protein
MFRQLIAYHPQGALMVLAKITIKHEHSSTVMGVAAYHGLVCAVYSVRVLLNLNIYFIYLFLFIFKFK